MFPASLLVSICLRSQWVPVGKFPRNGTGTCVCARVCVHTSAHMCVARGAGAGDCVTWFSAHGTVHALMQRLVLTSLRPIAVPTAGCWDSSSSSEEGSLAFLPPGLQNPVFPVLPEGTPFDRSCTNVSQSPGISTSVDLTFPEAENSVTGNC